MMIIDALVLLKSISVTVVVSNIVMRNNEKSEEAKYFHCVHHKYMYISMT